MPPVEHRRAKAKAIEDAVNILIQDELSFDSYEELLEFVENNR